MVQPIRVGTIQVQEAVIAIQMQLVFAQLAHTSLPEGAFEPMFERMDARAIFGVVVEMNRHRRAMENVRRGGTQEKGAT